MPLHDWTKVPACIFHDFRQSWIVAISRALNDLIRPPWLYALIQRDQIDPPEFVGDETNRVWSSGGRLLEEEEVYAALANRVVIFRSDDDQTTGWIEIVSPGDCCSPQSWERFQRRQEMARSEEIGVLTIDLFLRTEHEASGNCVITSVPPYESYSKPSRTIVGLGEVVPGVDLSMSPFGYVRVPLEVTYREAWTGFPRPWKKVLEAPAHRTGGTS